MLVDRQIFDRSFVPATQPRPVLYVVACGAPPAGQLPSLVGFAQEQGWDVCVIATPDGMKFLDVAGLEDLTGHPVRSEYKDPAEPDVLPPAGAIVVAPATFNTVNKWAQGISDTLALGLLNEAVGLGLPLAAVPWTNAPLAAHPVFQRSITVLAEWGVRVILDLAQLPPATDGVEAFPWDGLRAELAGLRRMAGPP
jgi:Flavoprotein